MQASTGQVQGRHALGSSTDEDPGLSTHPSVSPAGSTAQPAHPAAQTNQPGAAGSASAAWPVCLPAQQPANDQTSVGATPACTSPKLVTGRTSRAWGVILGPDCTGWSYGAPPIKLARPPPKPPGQDIHHPWALCDMACAPPHETHPTKAACARVRARRQACAPQLFPTGSSRLLHPRTPDWVARAAFC